MSGPVATTQVVGQSSDLDPAFERNRIYLGDRWRKDHIDTERPAEVRIHIERSRIAFEVLRPIELNGVDEDADDDRRAFGSGAANEAGVPFVKGSHGWNQTDQTAGTPRRDLRAEVGNGLDKLEWHPLLPVWNSGNLRQRLRIAPFSHVVHVGPGRRLNRF